MTTDHEGVKSLLQSAFDHLLITGGPIASVQNVEMDSIRVIPLLNLKVNSFA